MNLETLTILTLIVWMFAGVMPILYFLITLIETFDFNRRAGWRWWDWLFAPALMSIWVFTLAILILRVKHLEELERLNVVLETLFR